METRTVDIIVNGEPRSVARDSSIDGLLVLIGLDLDEIRGVAVALNDEVVRREDWARTAVGEGDRIEIVTAWQGG